MVDPLANPQNDPYELLGVSDRCTPTEAESAMDAFLVRTRGREIEALDACDILRDPARRLMVDIFRYPASSESRELTPPTLAELDAVAALIGRQVAELAAPLAWERVLPATAVDEIPWPGDGTESP
jgi:hypothetical protein